MLRGQAAALAGLAPRDEQLGHLLRDGRSPFDQAPREQIAHQSAADSQRIDTRVAVEPPILGRNRGRGENGRQVVGRDRDATGPLCRPHLVEGDAVSVHDYGGRALAAVQQPGLDRAAAHPHADGQAEDDRADRYRAPTRQPESHLFTSTTAVAVLPNTSG